ncbi:MAG TPA: hypothetical protein VGE65_03525 [Sphingobium sp.]
MTTTSAKCRDQQAYHRERAEGAALENVRVIAVKAAVAWGKEAVRQEMREANGERRRTQGFASVEAAAAAAAEAAVDAEAADVPGPGPGAPDDRQLSENPDRGFGSA